MSIKLKISYKNWVQLGIGMMLACCAVWPYGCKEDEKDIAVTGVSVDPTAVTFTTGEPQSVTATVLPREANQKVTWSSDNNDIAKVDSVGLITPVAVGRTTVTVTSETDKTKEASVTVTVDAAVFRVERVTVEPKSVTLEVGDTVVVTAGVFPELADRQVRWSSQNTNVATVKDGVVEGVWGGTTNIIATSVVRPSIADTLSVTVKPRVYPDPVAYSPEVENYNYALGTQTFAPCYSFSEKNSLVETAEQIRAMGSNILKFSLIPEHYGMADPLYPFNHNLFEYLEPFSAVLDMDFKYNILWVYTPTAKLTDAGYYEHRVPFLDGMTEEEKQIDYEDIYKLADYLLTRCAGTGKEFIIGHWEGDWILTNTNIHASTIEAVKLQGMTDWYNTRQRAIEDAKAAHSGSDVKVWQCADIVNVNTVITNPGNDRIVNRVIPHTTVDYVSYSSYEAVGGPYSLSRVLDYIEEKLPPKDGFDGKRVFIAEYGFPHREHTAGGQDRAARRWMKQALQWGCPFVLYWQMYDNECLGNDKYNGYWLINNLNEKQPVHYTHYSFYAAMKKWVHEYNERNGRLPSREEYFAHAVGFF